MVLAYHVIFTAYGFWLPNDPRGSWSDFVWAWELARFGSATKTRARQSVACMPHDRAFRLSAKQSLLRPPGEFNGIQARAIGHGFEEACSQGNYEISACSILPNHVHLIINRHAVRDVEWIVRHLKAKASAALTAENLHPFQDHIGRRGNRPSVWSESFWRVYLNNDTDIDRALKYVNDNPTKEGLRRQDWDFVQRNSCLAPALGPGDGSRPRGRG